jgi:iron-sulfur cluster assembly accessory protein
VRIAPAIGLALSDLDHRHIANRNSVPFLAGSDVDFVDDLIGTSFRVVNPVATASCGCGISFSI